MIRWYLEGYFQNNDTRTQHPLTSLPIVLGRNEALACVISAPSVSRNHAKIEEIGQQLWIKDLGSRNGTYVNRKQISKPVLIYHGDVLHFGTAEFRLIDVQHASSGHAPDPNIGETKIIAQAQLSENFPFGVIALEKLIAEKLVSMVYQPIIVAPDLSICGYEVLGRGASQELPNSPLELFHIAESFGLEVTLSEIMRDCGVENAVQHGLKGTLFVNTHPAEMKMPDRLLASLTELRGRFPTTSLTLEIHEQSVTGNSDLLRSVKQQLDTLSINLAFDDFGVGQSRLMEMVETKPKLIKFDRVLINDINNAGESRVNLLRRLKDLASELSIETLAECVSSAGEYKICQSMGFDYYQGFYFEKPKPAEYFTGHQDTMTGDKNNSGNTRL